MTVRMTISMTEEHAEQVEQLVKSGEYASSSEVLRHGLRLLAAERVAAEQNQKEHKARLKAIKADLKQRLAGEFVPEDIASKWLENERLVRAKQSQEK